MSCHDTDGRRPLSRLIPAAAGTALKPICLRHARQTFLRAALFFIRRYAFPIRVENPQDNRWIKIETRTGNGACRPVFCLSGLSRLFLPGAVCLYAFIFRWKAFKSTRAGPCGPALVIVRRWPYRSFRQPLAASFSKNDPRSVAVVTGLTVETIVRSFLIERFVSTAGS